MRDPAVKRKSPSVAMVMIVAFGVLLAALAVAVSHGLGGGHSGPATGSPPIIEQTPEEGHLWDTEDPGAAMIRLRDVIVVVVVGGPLVLVVVAYRRWRAGQPDAGSAERAIPVSAPRRQHLLAGNGLNSGGHGAGDERPLAVQFPPWVSDIALINTVERIANDAAAYKSGTVPEGPGRFVAEAHLAGPDEQIVFVKVVVEPEGEGVLTAHPSRASAPDGDERAVRPDRAKRTPLVTTPADRVRDALELACAALPPTAANYATENPDHPDSIGTLAYFDELLAQGELEVALYALAEIARGVRAEQPCWDTIDEAAALLNLTRRKSAEPAPLS